MTTTPRSIWVALLCAGLTGCALLPAIGINLAAQGAMGLVGIGLGSIDATQEQSEKDRCVRFTAKGSSITESLETTIPVNEGEVKLFEPASWRPEFAREGYPQVERSRTPVEGKLAVTERSLYFVPPPGATSLRIPYELVQDVEVRGGAATEPRAMIVKSCFGRFDIVTFGQRQPNGPDPETTTAAAAQVKARMTVAHAAADK